MGNKKYGDTYDVDTKDIGGDRETLVGIGIREIANEVADPGDGEAIAVTKSGSCNLVTGGAETRTLAAPSFLGQLLSMNLQTDEGDCVVTCATTVNQTGNDTLTFADAGDNIVLIAGQSGANLRWRVVCNDGVALSTA